MKRYIYLLSLLLFIFSCDNEPSKNQLLEAKIDGQYFSFTGSADKYTDYVNSQKTGYEYQIYNHDRHSFLIEAYDDTFTKIIFNFPEFTAQYIVELTGGQSKTYEAVSGRFRILGNENGNLRGDFYFKAKNILNSSDSVMITDGYYDIFLNESDRTFPR
ncbi:MAG TPA: hypothetical protein DCZ51_13465 [Bacteroidales bacterium]|nr:hypothetical protein [Bacteroidales bacterium]